MREPRGEEPRATVDRVRELPAENQESGLKWASSLTEEKTEGQAERMEDGAMRYETVLWATGDGDEFRDSVAVAYEELERFLGHPHDGAPEDDEAIVRELRASGAPEWVETAPGCADEDGYYLVGPEHR